jgi:hypothetical protein
MDKKRSVRKISVSKDHPPLFVQFMGNFMDGVFYIVRVALLFVGSITSSAAGRRTRRETDRYVLIMWQEKGMAKQRDKT